MWPTTSQRKPIKWQIVDDPVDKGTVVMTDDRAAQAIALELDELPLPYNYDVKAFAAIRLPALREHIERVGTRIWPL